MNEYLTSEIVKENWKKRVTVVCGVMSLFMLVLALPFVYKNGMFDWHFLVFAVVFSLGMFWFRVKWPWLSNRASEKVVILDDAVEYSVGSYFLKRVFFRDIKKMDIGRDKNNRTIVILI